MIRRIFEQVIWVGVIAIVAILIAGAITYSRVQLLSETARMGQIAASVFDCLCSEFYPLCRQPNRARVAI